MKKKLRHKKAISPERIELIMKTDLNNLICFNFYVGWRKIAAIHKLIYGNDYTVQLHFLLELCDYDTPIKVNELSKGLNLDPSAVSTLVDRMVKRGLLRRDHGKADRRTVFITLTQEGVKVKAHLKRQSDNFNQVITEGISSANLATLQSIVVKITRNREKQKKQENKELI